MEFHLPDYRNTYFKNQPMVRIPSLIPNAPVRSVVADSNTTNPQKGLMIGIGNQRSAIIAPGIQGSYLAWKDPHHQLIVSRIGSSSIYNIKTIAEEVQPKKSRPQKEEEVPELNLVARPLRPGEHVEELTVDLDLAVFPYYSTVNNGTWKEKIHPLLFPTHFRTANRTVPGGGKASITGVPIPQYSRLHNVAIPVNPQSRIVDCFKAPNKRYLINNAGDDYLPWIQEGKIQDYLVGICRDDGCFDGTHTGTVHRSVGYEEVYTSDDHQTHRHKTILIGDFVLSIAAEGERNTFYRLIDTSYVNGSSFKQDASCYTGSPLASGKMLWTCAETITHVNPNPPDPNPLEPNPPVPIPGSSSFNVYLENNMYNVFSRTSPVSKLKFTNYDNVSTLVPQHSFPMCWNNQMYVSTILGSLNNEYNTYSSILVFGIPNVKPIQNQDETYPAPNIDDMNFFYQVVTTGGVGIDGSWWGELIGQFQSAMIDGFIIYQMELYTLDPPVLQTHRFRYGIINAFTGDHYWNILSGDEPRALVDDSWAGIALYFTKQTTKIKVIVSDPPQQ